jgi:hypothetical protein
VDRDVHAKVVRAARGERKSISAWMTEAARRALRVKDGLAAIAEWEAEHGELTKDELDRARKRLLGSKREAARHGLR